MLDVSRLRELAVSDAGFVFDPVTGHTFNVNQTALAVLRALKEGHAPEAVVASVRDGFELEPEDDVQRDVDEFIARLRDQGLVK